MSGALPMGYFLQRGDRLFGLSGWWKQQDVALRFATREEAQAAIREMRLSGDVMVVERPYQPSPVPRPDAGGDYDPFGVSAA